MAVLPPAAPAVAPHLVFGFNANISEPQHAAARARVEALMARPVLRECFGRVALESAYLSGSDDLYDKRRLDSNWTQGPNNLFYHFLDSAARGGYAYMAQLEADIVPLRENWLERMQCVAAGVARVGRRLGVPVAVRAQVCRRRGAVHRARRRDQVPHQRERAVRGGRRRLRRLLAARAHLRVAGVAL